jgi:inorganic triphosphatase YgiF
MSAELTGKLETERKFDVGLDFALPDLRDLGGSAQSPAPPPEVERLIARYYDTDDLRLAAAGVTLRRRTGGRDSGWHLKLPVGGDTRREVHAPLGDGDEPVPAGLAELVATWAGGRPLRPVATLETTRTVRQITGPDGRILAELADDLVTGHREALPASAGHDEMRPAVLAWREIEVELVSGTPAILAAAGQRLRQSGAMPSGSANKLSRLLAAPPAPA